MYLMTHIPWNSKKLKKIDDNFLKRKICKQCKIYFQVPLNSRVNTCNKCKQKPKIKSECKNCGLSFYHYKRTFCNECLKKKSKKKCNFCGEDFFYNPLLVRKKLCSKECSKNYRKEYLKKYYINYIKPKREKQKNEQKTENKKMCVL